jgi:hypothetical protein
MEPSQCLLANFSLRGNILELRFINGSTAIIHSKNIEGDMELIQISQRLDGFLGKSYKEILEANF